MWRPDDVLEYWFPAGYDADYATHRQRMAYWFGGAADVDRELAARFGSMLDDARQGELDDWADTPRGRLALIILLDQFSRSIYRGTPAAYAQDPKAIDLCLDGLARGFAAACTVAERMFFILPLCHSESPEHQERHVAENQQLLAMAPPELRPLYEFAHSQAQGHREVIQRFGRHPQRNEILGRSSTPAELEYLAGTPVYKRRPPE